MKIRAIAVTLIAEPHERRPPLPVRAREYLRTFMSTMERLERISPANGASDEHDEEEAELRAWADLREYQLDFARKGGLLGVS